jgi:predicted O-methyltransferase YrrM
MSKSFAQKSSITSPQVARYVSLEIMKDSQIEAQLREETSQLPNAGMISSSDVGAFLAFLVKSIGAVKAIEIGTFTGYTALKIAQALPQGGKLICCDINAEWTGIGKKYWQEAQVADKIDLRLAPAMDTLSDLMKQNRPFDFAFIDADKSGYEAYYETCLKLLRPGGLIVLDNMLWDGTVADEKITDETTVILRKLNAKIKKDSRVEACLMTVGDGLMLVRKK